MRFPASLQGSLGDTHGGLGLATPHGETLIRIARAYDRQQLLGVRKTHAPWPEGLFFSKRPANHVGAIWSLIITAMLALLLVLRIALPQHDYQFWAALLTLQAVCSIAILSF
jgi:hypothetical protein